MTVTIVPVEDPERVRAELEEFRRDIDELRAREEALAVEYPDRWVAWKDGRLFHAVELDTLFAQLRRAGVDPGTAPRRHFATNKPFLVL